MAGNYYIRYKYYNSMNPPRFAVSPVIKIQVVDGCAPPSDHTPQLSLTAPTIDSLVYTVGSPAINYEVPAWTTVPAYCADLIPFQEQVLIRGNFGINAVVFDGTHVNIFYDAALDLCGSTSDGMTYTVTIAVQLSGVPSQLTFDVVFMNPCHSLIMTADILILPDFSYTLGDLTGNSWTHQGFPIPGEGLCGSLKYTADFGDLTGVVTYLQTTRTSTIYTADSGLMAT